MDDLETELRIKKICRFCLNQDEKVLSNLYSRENRWKSSAPLPLQVMACVSIEVFTNDGMPSTVCEHCRMQMEHCYRFKQMCKKADTALRQFPLTGKWPPKLDHPKIPQELIKQPNSKILNTNVQKSKTAANTSATSTTPEKLKPEKMNETANTTPKLKLLNKNPVKILNKVPTLLKEPVLKQPVIKHAKDGSIELVTEIIDTESFKDIDPVASAEPIETNVFPCQHCERSFPLQQLLDIHMVNHSRERNFGCESCDKKFFTKYDLGKHEVIHSKDKPYKCIICDKSFTRSTLLLRHEKIHTDIPKFLCVHCEKAFISKDDLAKHTERHNKKRPFPCKFCPKSFAFKQGLERHEVIHAKEQPFPCQYCNLSFPTPSKLSRHLTAHAGDRPYPCKLCAKSYLLSHHLSRHLRSHKDELEVNFKCYDCGQTFTTRDSLIYHSAVHATETLICPICKEQFDDVDSVTEHIKKHALGEQYACEFCDLIFMTQDKLDDHCTGDHAEDMAVYDEHDKNNIKNESCDGEIIQEFIIEEFDDDTAVPSQDIFVKEEVIETNYQPNSILHRFATNRKGRKRTKIPESEVILGEINDLDDNRNNDINLDEFTAEESALFEELINEPPTKRTKSEDTEQQQNEKKLKQPSKMKQTTLKVVNKLPKDIVVSRKETKTNVQIIDNTVVKEPQKPVNVKELNKSSAASVSTSNTSKETYVSSKQVSDRSKTIKVGDKRIKVKKITVTKAEAELMAKQGRIDFNKEGTMILKNLSKKKQN